MTASQGTQTTTWPCLIAFVATRPRPSSAEMSVETTPLPPDTSSTVVVVVVFAAKMMAS